MGVYDRLAVSNLSFLSSVVIQEMSWQMHYNKGADLMTYLVDSSVFNVKDGYVDALEGTSFVTFIHMHGIHEYAL